VQSRGLYRIFSSCRSDRKTYHLILILYLFILTKTIVGQGVAYWLRHYATNRKVAVRYTMR
jgi:hypothetical protein